MPRANDIADDLERLMREGSPLAQSKITLLRLCVAAGGSYAPQLRDLQMAGQYMAEGEGCHLVFEGAVGVFTITDLGRSVVSALRPMVA